jgi:ribonuclease J
MNFSGTTKERMPGTGAPRLKIYTLSGTESVTKNLTVYEYGDDIILVDCGVGFPDMDQYGVNVVIPDFTYILENSHKVRGLFITHGHEDHIGAVPYLLRELNIPIYASKLVQGFLNERVSDRPFKDLAGKIKFHLFSPESEEITLGVFKVSAFCINHSVPSSTGLAIRTPEGMVLHIADYKIDWTPVLDPPIDLGRISELGRNGVLCLLSDCLNVTTEGYSKSEMDLNDTFSDIFKNADGRQILITTISSNIARMFQIIDAATKSGRKVVLAGRSIDQSVSVARRLGYLPFADDIFVKDADSSKYKQGDIVYIIAGCYGQEGSALARFSRGEHDTVKLVDNALVVFSADPNPPGVEADVEKVMSALTLAGAEVLYSKIQNNLHVSGHGTRGDLTTIAAISKAKYYIPIGGTITRMRAYTNMIGELGIGKERVFECMEGDCVEFSNGRARKGQKIETKPVFIDNNGTDEVNPIVIRDRDQLSSDGVFVVVIPASQSGEFYPDKVEVVTRGFIYVKASKELLDKSKQFIAKIFDKGMTRSKDWQDLKRKLESRIEDFLRKETGRRPMVIVHSITV